MSPSPPCRDGGMRLSCGESDTTNPTRDNKQLVGQILTSKSHHQLQLHRRQRLQKKITSINLRPLFLASAVPSHV